MAGPGAGSRSGSGRKLLHTLEAISVVLFLSAICSVVFLPKMGMYLSVGIIIAGSFSILLCDLVREKAKQREKLVSSLQQTSRKLKTKN